MIFHLYYNKKHANNHILEAKTKEIQYNTLKNLYKTLKMFHKDGIY